MIAERWIADKSTYNRIQKLKTFVDLVSNLKGATNEVRLKAKEIRSLIANIDKPESYKNWYICLDIFDQKVQNGEAEGLGWRNWSVYFEFEQLCIEAESHYIFNSKEDNNEDFKHFEFINFSSECKGDRVSSSDKIESFITDALNYKNYITKSFNDIQIDIDILQPKQ